MNSFLAVVAAAALLTGSALATTYTVKSGDTLYSVAQKAGMEPAALMRLNGLSSSTIQVGQRISLGGTASRGAAASSAPVAAAPPPSASRSGGAYVRAAASRFLGIRFVLGGNGGYGIDCSGFTHAVYSQLGVNLPRTARAQFNVGTPVSRGNLQSGDLVFFNTMGGISHVGIYLGDGQFADANSYYGHTMIEPMTTAYWSSRYVGARRILN
ncbi:C40 family peptidase [Deinococcus sp.]|uniref:C40 family peptidase n=1 Tax=Deinococcus sp. TaxID=47478 RepID=UPI003CC537AF